MGLPRSGSLKTRRSRVAYTSIDRGPVYTYTDSFVSAGILLRLQNLGVHTYPDLLRFRPSTCIRIRSKFKTKMFEWLIEHALMNKLRRLP